MVCAACGSHSGPNGQSLLRCKGCKNIFYCSKEHQELDWPNHKPACRELRLAAYDRLEKRISFLEAQVLSQTKMINELMQYKDNKDQKISSEENLRENLRENVIPVDMETKAIDETEKYVEYLKASKRIDVSKQVEDFRITKFFLKNKTLPSEDSVNDWLFRLKCKGRLKEVLRNAYLNEQELHQLFRYDIVGVVWLLLQTKFPENGDSLEVEETLLNFVRDARLVGHTLYRCGRNILGPDGGSKNLILHFHIISFIICGGDGVFHSPPGEIIHDSAQCKIVLSCINLVSQHWNNCEAIFAKT